MAKKKTDDAPKPPVTFELLRDECEKAIADGWTIDEEAGWIVPERKLCSPLGAVIRDTTYSKTPLLTVRAAAERLGVMERFAWDIEAGFSGRTGRGGGGGNMEYRDPIAVDIGARLRAWLRARKEKT